MAPLSPRSPGCSPGDDNGARRHQVKILLLRLALAVVNLFRVIVTLGLVLASTHDTQWMQHLL